MCGTDKMRNFSWEKVYRKYEKFIIKTSEDIWKDIAKWNIGDSH